MTLEGANLEGYLLSEDDAQRASRLILQQYRAADKLIEAELDKLFANMAGLAPEDRYNWLIQYDRNIKLQKQIRDIYTKHDVAAAGLHAQQGAVAMSNNYYRQFYLLEWNSPISFAALDPNLINYAVTGQIASWKALSNKLGSAGDWIPAGGSLLDVIKKNRTDILSKMQIAINSGVLAGQSNRQVAKSVSKIIGTVTKKGKASGQMARALRISRTEINRLSNAGAYASGLVAEDQGIGMEKMWNATLDSATRPAHATADGQKRPIDERYLVGGEKLMYPGDSAGSAWNVINDRCVSVNLPNGVMPEQRRGRDPVTGKNEVFSYKTFNDWAAEKGLSTNKYGQIVA